MKKIFIASILAAGFVGSAMADGYCPPQLPSVISTSGASVSSVSAAGTNQVSMHAAFAKANNQTSVSGGASGISWMGGAATQAQTSGSTMTGALGFGAGGASAGAQQTGYGTVTAATGGNQGGYDSRHSQQAKPEATATSTVFTNTGSNATVYNTGAALSGSQGTAFNMSAAGYLGTKTNAGSAGADSVVTFGIATPHDSANAGGEAGQDGSAFAKGVSFR